MEPKVPTATALGKELGYSTVYVAKQFRLGKTADQLRAQAKRSAERKALRSKTTASAVGPAKRRPISLPWADTAAPMVKSRKTYEPGHGRKEAARSAGMPASTGRTM